MLEAKVDQMRVSEVPRDRSALKAGVVGCGRFGARHAAAWLEVKGVELVAVCDRNFDKAQIVAARAKCRHVRSIGDLPDGLDCVSIAVEPDALEQAATRCLERGLHVLLEKPFCMSAEGARRLGHYASSRGLLLQAGYVERYHPAIAVARRLVLNPRHIQSTRISQAPAYAHQVGVVLDLMSHDIEHAIEFGGDVKSVSLDLISGDDVAECRHRMTLHFESGFTATLEAGYSDRVAARALTFLEGDVVVDVDLHNGIVRSPQGELRVPTGNPLAGQFASFVDCIANRREPAAGAARAYQVLKIVSMMFAQPEMETPWPSRHT